MDITVARVTQLIFRAAMLFLIAKGGMDSQHATALAHAGAEFFGAGLAALADFLIHSARFGAMAKAVETFFKADDTAAEMRGDADVAAPSSNGGDSGKTLAMGLLLAASISLIFITAGCAPTLKQRWAQAQTAQDGTAKSLVTLWTSHQISDADLVTAKPYLDATQAAIDQMKVAADAGDTNTFNTALTAFQAANAKLIEWQAAHNAKGVSHGNSGSSIGVDSGGNGGAANGPATLPAGQSQ